MNGKRLLVLYSGLALTSAAATVGLYAQFSQPRDVPAFYYDVDFFEYDETGARKYTHTDHYAVRGDGSSAMVDNSLLARLGERRVTVNDYAKRVSWVTSLVGRTATTLPLVERAMPAVHYDECNEGEVGTLGQYEVRKQRRIVRKQEDEIALIFDVWRAPELGCVMLRTALYDGDGRPTHERVASTIVIGEPDPTFFQVPEGYVESSPMQAHQKLVDLGVAPPFQGDGLGLMDRAERRYRGEPGP
jgi:hypothetical protein